jgi:O-antigen/teichoic acid export membrane protein
VLDFGVGPAIVRFAAAARGRKDVDELNGFASAGLALYAAIGAITLPVGVGLAFAVPYMGHVPQRLVWDARVATLLIVLSLALRFPLGLFNNLLVAQQRWDLQNLGNFVSTALYAGLLAVLLPVWGGLVLLGAVTFGTSLLRLLIPLAWLRRELPELRIRRRFATRARMGELLAFSWSNFLVHVAQKIVFSTDVVVIGIVLGAVATGDYGPAAKLFALAFGIGTAVTSLLLPAYAELEGRGDADRQRALLLSGLRAGTSMMLLLALPLMLMPDLLIHGWIGGGFHASYAPMAILGGVLLVHQPIYVFTQFLIARAMQREVARVSIATTLANLALSFALVEVWGIWGVALSTLVTDIVALLWIVPRLAAPAAGTTVARLARAIAQPLIASVAPAALILVGLARIWSPRTLPELGVIGAVWALAAGAAIWRYGLSPSERAGIARNLRPGVRQVAVEPGGM